MTVYQPVVSSSLHIPQEVNMILLRLLFATIVLCLAGTTPLTSSAQPQLSLPQSSPGATVSQTVGTSTITVSYHRPGVKGRKIWGEVVPYNEVWRAGANENTTISFSDPVKIDGKDLPAGVYGLHMIPTEGEWTIIFNRNSTSWGSFFYDAGEDALRVLTKPEPSEHVEWLEYEFSDLSRSSAKVSLRWEKLRVPFTVEFDVNNVVLSNARTSFLRGPAGFTWQGFNQAANFALQNNIDLQQGLTWADLSISLNENFTNMRTKAGILKKLGRMTEAESLREESMKIALEADVNTMGYEHLAQNNMKKAIELFKKNVKDYPKSWNVYDSLGEAYEKDGQMRLAVENYTHALSMVKDDANRNRITTILKRLKSKE